MQTKLIREWKKVFETDLSYIAFELKDEVTRPAVILLEGVMGSGKTTFAKAFIDDADSMSPSYSILSDSTNILHADFYRIEKSSEIVHLELPLYLDNKQYFIVEWGEKFINTIEKEIPENYSIYRMNITINDSNKSNTDQETILTRNFSLHQMDEL